jgi:tetratricopeptide (TPR) repeat protein
VFVYNPLGAHSSLYKLYTATPPAPVEPVAPPELLDLYAQYAPQVAGVSPDRIKQEEGRDITRRLRTFLPALLDGVPLPPDFKTLPVVFPTSPLLDARSLDTGTLRAAFITSGTLNAIQLFSRTVSCGAHLNQMAFDDLRAIEDRPPDQVLLAWMTMVADQRPGTTTRDLLRSTDIPGGLPALLFEATSFAAERLRPGLARHHLAHCLMQMTLRAIRQAARTGWHDAWTAAIKMPPGAAPVDAEFLALLILSFVALHEIGHVALGHNRIGYRGTEAELAWSEVTTSRLRGADGVENVVDLVGSQSSFELAADVFAVGVVDDSLREPLLEAASLWCAANERAHMVGGDRVGDLKRMTGSPDSYPSHAVRVWYLNGRLSGGRRAGAIARQIADAAENIGGELHDGEDRIGGDPDGERAGFASLWQLVERATADDPSRWTPPVSSRREPAHSPEQQALETGLLAWDAGHVTVAEQYFRAAAGADDRALAAQARGLVGRMLEEQGDSAGAEAEYRSADAMGDGNAANDLGTMLKDRGDLEEAIAAFERADQRDNAPGAFNLGLIAEERGDRATAVAAFRRADRRGHPQAALNLGILSFHAGQLDVSEAALRRAEARDVENAATYLGITLNARGDARSAEAAWRRGAARGELDSMHNLGFLLEGQGRLFEARGAYFDAVMRGRERSTGNFHAVSARLEQEDNAESLAAAAAQGDVEAAYQLGFVLARREERAAAMEAFERAEGLGHPKAANEIGMLLSHAGDAAGAEAAFRRGADRGHPRAWFNLGAVLKERGDEDGAQAAWERADKLGDPLAPTNLGSMIEATGNLPAALAAYQRADERGDALGRVRRGRLLEDRGDLDQAEAAYRRADEQGDGYAAAALGRLLYWCGNQTEAEAAWRRGDLRGNGDAALQLGQVLRQRGELDAAEAAMRRAVERGQPSASRHLAFLLSQEGYHRDAAGMLMTPVGEHAQGRRT